MNALHLYSLEEPIHGTLVKTHCIYCKKQADVFIAAGVNIEDAFAFWESIHVCNKVELRPLPRSL